MMSPSSTASPVISCFKEDGTTESYVDFSCFFETKDGDSIPAKHRVKAFFAYPFDRLRFKQDAIDMFSHWEEKRAEAIKGMSLDEVRDWRPQWFEAEAAR